MQRVANITPQSGMHWLSYFNYAMVQARFLKQRYNPDALKADCPHTVRHLRYPPKPFNSRSRS
jgi:hypothetical protein